MERRVQVVAGLKDLKESFPIQVAEFAVWPIIYKKDQPSTGGYPIPSDDALGF
jgi:hypothetical protein